MRTNILFVCASSLFLATHVNAGQCGSKNNAVRDSEEDAEFAHIGIIDPEADMARKRAKALDDVKCLRRAQIEMGLVDPTPEEAKEMSRERKKLADERKAEKAARKAAKKQGKQRIVVAPRVKEVPQDEEREEEKD